MSNSVFSRREWAFFGACSYLGALFISTIILWWAVLAGGSPLTIKSSSLVDSSGNEIEFAHAGESVGIRRVICSEQEVGVRFYPTIKSKDGALYPLPSGMLYLVKGCEPETHGFVVPDLPTGVYSYQNAIQYQSNLVGRDEATLTPTVTMVIKNDKH